MPKQPVYDKKMQINIQNLISFLEDDKNDIDSFIFIGYGRKGVTNSTHISFNALPLFILSLEKYAGDMRCVFDENTLNMNELKSKVPIKAVKENDDGGSSYIG